MKIVYHQNFQKNFKKRIAPNQKLASRFYQRLNLLVKSPNHSSLRRHWSFSVTGDIRVIYRIEGKTIFLYDIGTHAQVY